MTDCGKTETEFSFDAEMSKARALADELRESLPKEVRAAACTLKSKLVYKALSLRELLIHRVSDLTDACIVLFEQQRFVPAFIVARAIVETVAIQIRFHQVSLQFLNDWDEAPFDQFLMKGVLGNRLGLTSPSGIDIGATNIQTIIGHIGKIAPAFKSSYEELCEFTHPNWSGMMGAYSAHSSPFVLLLGKEHNYPPAEIGLVPFVICLECFRDSYNGTAEALYAINERYESAPATASGT